MKFRSFLRYLDLRWFRGLKVRPTRPIQNRLVPLALEVLETRTVPSGVPTIIKTLTTPADGSTISSAKPTIQVVFSEAMTGSATVTSNYFLFGSAGNSIPINSVTLTAPDSSGHETATINYNGGAGLILDTYTLFVRGDQLTEAVDGQNLPLAPAGEYVVANGGTSNVSIVSMPGSGTLGSLADYNLPPIGATAATPVAATEGTLTSSGLPDLVVVDSANNQVDIFAGQPVSSGGGFDVTPDLVLALPTGSANKANSVTLGDFDNNGTLDIAVANAGTNTVTVFLNATSAGNLSFNPGVDYTGTGAAALVSPGAIVAGDFDGATDTNGKPILDLAVVNTAVDASGNYDVVILQGNGSGSFGTPNPAVDVFNTGVTTPNSLVSGTFATNAGSLPDLAVGGTGGLRVLFNNTTGVGQFDFKTKQQTLTTTPLVNLAAGASSVTSSVPGSQLYDLVAIQNQGGSQVDVWQNKGPMPGGESFTFMSSSTFGSNLTGLALAPLVAGDNRLDFVVTENNAAGKVDVLLNDSSLGTTSFGAPVSYTVDNNPVAVVAANFNGAKNGNNALEQIVTLNSAFSDISLLQGAGDGTLEAAVNTSLRPTTQAIAVGDLNGDAIPDIVIAENTSGGFGGGGSSSITVMLGQLSNGVVTYGAPGNTFTYTPTNSGLSAKTIVSIAIGDIYGGKFNDIVVADQSDSTLQVLKNNLASSSASLGAGSFTPETAIGFNNVTSTPEQLVLADFNGATYANGNPILDIAVATEGTSGGFHGHGNPGGVAVFIGNGNGTFANPVLYESGNTAVALAVADFNNDGNLDFVVANSAGGGGSGNVRVFYGDGTGAFTNPGGSINLNISSPVSVAVGSLTGNGFADIIVASSSTGATSGGVAVLLNQLGTGFGSPIVTSVLPGTALQSVVVAHVNDDPFPDLIVTTVPGTGGSKTDNVFTLMGNGDGTFQRAVPYIAGGTTSPTVAPSYGALVSDPLIRVTTFHSGGTTVEPNLIVNGNFDIPDLNGVKGNLDGWQQYDLPASAGGSHSQWAIQTGTTSPLSGTSVTPPSGTYQAMLDEANLQPLPQQGNNPNTAADYAGTSALYQGVFIPNGASSVTLSMTLSLYNFGSDTSTTNTQGWSDNTTPQALDYRNTAVPNQQVRVDIMDPSNPDSIADATNTNFLGITGATGLLGNIFLTTSGDVFTNPVNIAVAADGTITVNGTATGSKLNLAQFAGKSIILRIATTNNQGQLLVGVQNVQLDVLFPDTTPPVISNLGLRDPGYTDPSDAPLANGTLPQHSTDPTIVGQVSDIGGLNTPAGFKQGNIAYIELDLSNDNFSGAAGDVIQKTTSWDALGNFSFTIPNPVPGLNTINVAAVDEAGLVSSIQTFTFFYQGASLTDWQANGPDAINVVGQAGVNYTTVSGDVTGIAVDKSDPSGNTFYVGSDNGGVWKTTDGGNDYTPLTDYVTNAQGQPVSVPVGALAVGNGINPATNQTVDVVYVGTGVGNDNLDSRSGFGILMSLDGGQTWHVDGNSGSVLAGATITSIVVDNANPNFVYVAVASDSTINPATGLPYGAGVYESTNALDFANATWTNITPGNKMDLPNGSTLGAGASLFSVTSLIEDPNTETTSGIGRLIIGIGNIGLTPGAAGASTGVWLSTNFGQSWLLKIGSTDGVPNNKLPSGFSGNNLGRVTVVMATARPADEGIVYVLIGTPPTSTTAPNFNYGSEFQGSNGSGLYFTNNNFLDFTDVMLNVNVGGNNGTQNFQPINLLGENAANAGALIVDPTDANVVYVGGSTRGITNPSNQDQSFIRVDVGNIDGYQNQNNGDDLTKYQQGFFGNAGGQSFYDGITATNPYKGEGVYWYNLAGATSGDSSNVQLLPPDITSLMFDPQGRLLIGTDSGVWRGVSEGYGYDYTSGGSGIVRRGKGQSAFSAPGMTLTALNGNLQISDLTSVAIDPSTRGVLDTTQFFTGTAGSAGSSAILQWSSQGVTGPTVNGVNLGIGTAAYILIATPPLGAAAGTPNTIYRVWEYANGNAVVPEVSTDNGATFSSLSSTSLPTTGLTAGTFPTFVIDPTAILEGNPADNGNKQIFQSALLLGTDPLFFTSTSGTVWDPASTNPNIAAGGNITAAALATSNGNIIPNVWFVGTNQGQVFITTSQGGDNWPESDTGLPAASVTSINVNPTNYQIAFVTFGSGGVNNQHVYMTTNAGQGAGTVWVPIGTNTGLPNVAVNSMVLVPITIGGLTTYNLYVATDVGVYESTNLGQSWTRVGVGMPNVPVVNLQYNATFGTIAAATQGRGVFILSTNKIGAHVTGIANGSTTATTTAISSIDVTFNEPINPSSFTPGTITLTGPGGNVIPLTGVAAIDSGADQEFQLSFAAQTGSGFYHVKFGPNVTDQTGNAMDQNQNGINGENPGDIYNGNVYFFAGTNSAPVLGNPTPTFPAVGEDGLGTNNGTVVLGSWVTSTLAITDANPNLQAFQGIAITGIDDSKGTWEYSQNGGATWTNIPTTVSETHALLLRASASNLLRYVPGASYDSLPVPPSGVLGNAAFTFRAWDMTTGLDPATGADGTFADTSTNGGSTAFSSTEGTATVQVLYVNHAPSFTLAGASTPAVLENSGLQLVTSWATNLMVGPANESSQTMSFVVTNNNPSLFAIQPFLDANGTLYYTPATDANGSALVSVKLQDNGGTANGGQDTSAAQQFVITLTSVNQVPFFTPGANQATQVFSGLISVPWATSISAGAPNESSQALNFIVGNDSPSLFVVQPTISPDGTLTYQVGNTTGTAHVTVLLHDNAGTANGGHDTTSAITFTITVLPVVSSGSADAVWISALYRELLQREIQPSEVTFWTNLLTGGMSRLAVATQITNSDEYHTVYIKNLFTTYLGRTAQSPDINYYLQEFHNGETPNQIKAEILSSGAYYTRNGGTDFGFVSGLFHDVLGEAQNQDPSGVSYWVSQLSSGLSRNTVATDILTSPQGEAGVVQGVFQTMLNRAASPGDVAFWSGLRDETLEASVAATPEYGVLTSAQFYNSQPDQNWLNQVFQDMLGRGIDANGIGYYILQIRAGVRYPDIVASILSSQEYRTDEVTAAFSHILHRLPTGGEVSFFVGLLNQGQSFEFVESEMYGSGEYFATQGGGTDDGFVAALYHDALNRPVDQVGLDTWDAQLAAVPSIQAVAFGVLNSGEAEADLVAADFLKYLRRSVDETGLLYWVGQLENGLTDEQFAAMLVGSPEYYARYSV